VIVFAALTVGSLGQEESMRDPSDGYWGEEPYYGGEGFDYSDHGYYEDEGPSVPQMMEWLDVSYYDLDDMVQTMNKTHDSHHPHSWPEDILEVAREKVLPEMCNQTADTCNLYNSFLLDCHCVEVFDGMSEQCRGLKCDLTQHLLDYGPRMIYDFLHTESIKDAVEVIHRELKLIFSSHNFCKCGRELMKSFTKCARFYHGNGLMSAMDCADFNTMQTYLRNLDLEALGAVWDKLVGGMCEKARRKGDDMCLDAVFEGLKEVADMVGGTIEDFSQWDDGSEKEMRQLEERCDRLFGPLRAFIDAGDDEVDMETINETHQDYWTMTLNRTSAFMDNLYCKWPCKKDRGSLFPCCMKRMLNDDSLYLHLERFVVSFVKLPIVGVGSYYWDDFTEMDRYAKEEVERAMKFKMPENIIELFKKTVNAGNHCKGRNLRCSN